MATFIYQATLTPRPEDDDGYGVTFADLPGCVASGDNLQEAASMAIDAAMVWIATALKKGYTIPDPTFKPVPKGSTEVIVAFDVSPDHVVKGPVVSATEASHRLHVTPGRITHMLDSGKLDGYREGRHTWITVSSINTRLADNPKAGRPRKNTTQGDTTASAYTKSK